MKTATALLEHIIGPFRPCLPLHRMIEEVNKLYHAAEAPLYDGWHPEIFQQTPHLWREMIGSAVAAAGTSRRWNILDFGCGTGFEARQLLNGLGELQIDHLTCYDSSPDMLQVCEAKIRPAFGRARFLDDLSALFRSGIKFNLLATNALLHHLPDPYETLTKLSGLLTDDAVWILGHEPSRRFYRNPECRRAYEEFVCQRRWRKYLSPRNYLDRAYSVFWLRGGPAASAAREAYRRGLFQDRPSAFAISRLVDSHVAHSVVEADSGRGFDIDEIEASLRGSWRLLWFQSYSFMGTYPEARLPRRWARCSRHLAELHTKDGANFCAVWTRGDH